MNEKTVKTILDVLTETINGLKLTIQSHEWYIASLEKQVKELNAKLEGKENE